MLIEGGRLHSLKALLEKAEHGRPSKPSTGQRPPMFGHHPPEPRRGLRASLRRLRAKLLRRAES